MNRNAPTSADEFRALAASFERWAQIAATKAERRDFLEMAKTARRSATERDANGSTVRQLDRRRTHSQNPPRSAG